ncbi:MAG TPA: ribokinase [Ktedonosporobacter sp.]|nr:ribokinase [Ktedonosporobacter sp.]
MGTVVVLGSLITDLVAQAPRLPLPGESLIGDDFATYLGGKGINQAIASARLGASVTLIGRVGTDPFGDAFFPILAHEGIDSRYVTRDASIGTGVSLIIIDANSGQNTIVATPRANLAVTAETVETALRSIYEQHTQSQPTAKAIFLAQCETSFVSYMAGLKLARNLGMTTILNAAPIPREPLGDDLFTLVDVLIVNEVEATILSQIAVTSIESAQTAAAALLARGPAHVIITLGRQGCLWCTHQDQSTECATIAPFPVKAVDTTAAGDAFCGALASALASNLPMTDALQHARAAGAITVTRKGAIAALPTADEVTHLLQSNQQ